MDPQTSVTRSPLQQHITPPRAGAIYHLPTNRLPSLLHCFGPGGGAQQALTAAEAASTRLSSYTQLPESITANKDDDDDYIDVFPGDFLGSDNNDGEVEFRKDAHGTSPMATKLSAAGAPLCLDPSPPILGTPTSPPKQRSALRFTSFALVASNPIPTMNDAVDMDPNFIEGVSKDGEGPGLHFITMSFIKDKTKIRDQLLKALASTVSILSANIPGVLVHCIQKDALLPPLSSSTASNFPTSLRV